MQTLDLSSYGPIGEELQTITQTIVNDEINSQGIDTESEFEVILPESGCKIGDSAFESKIGLNSVINLDKVKSIGLTVFGYTAIGGLIDLSSCESVCGFEATNITSVILNPDGCNITESAFRNCTGLENVYNLGKVKSIGSEAFCGANISGLVDLSSCTSVNGFGPNGSIFSSCTQITAVILNPSGCEIGIHAFNGCTSLKNIYNLNKVTSIGKMAFANTAIDGFLDLSSCTSVDGFSAGEDGGTGTQITGVMLNPSGCTIDSYCFTGCPITTIYNLNKVTSIGSFNLFQLSGFLDLSSCQNVGQDNFLRSGITGVLFANDAEIYMHTFMNNNSLSNLYNIDKVSYIDEYAFDICPNITGTIYLNSCNSLSTQSFKETGLTEAYIKNGCEYIAEGESRSFPETCTVTELPA